MTRIGDSLSGKRVLVTQASAFMGEVLCAAFAAHGATVIADERALAEPGLAEDAVARAGQVDVLVVNLGVPAPSTRAHEVTLRSDPGVLLGEDPRPAAVRPTAVRVGLRSRSPDRLVAPSVLLVNTDQPKETP